MRPLPVLDDLAPSQPVFDPAADDLLLLLGNDLSNFDALQSTLDGDVNSVLSAQSDIAGTFDTIGSIFTAIDDTFGKLNESYQDLDLTSTISEVMAFDDAFDSGVNSFAPDFSGAIAAFGNLIQQILQDVAAGLNAIWNALMAIIAQIENLIDWLLNEVYGLAGAINSLVGSNTGFAPGPVGGVGPIGGGI